MFHLPRYYDDLSDVREISKLTAGTLQTIQGEVVEVESKTLHDGRRILSVVLADEKGKCVEGVWFNQFARRPPGSLWAKAGLQRQTTLVSGPLADQPSAHPAARRDRRPAEHRRGRVSLDGERAGRSVARIHPPGPGSLLVAGGGDLAGIVADRSEALPDAAQALRQVHFPETLPQALTARRRFIYEEFLVLQVALALRRRELRDRRRAPICRSIRPSTPTFAGCFRFR